MGSREVAEFRSCLAKERDVAASTQDQALSALLFLYREVLKVQLPWLQNVDRVQRPPKLPVVFTREAVGDSVTGTGGVPPNTLAPMAASPFVENPG